MLLASTNVLTWYLCIRYGKHKNTGNLNNGCTSLPPELLQNFVNNELRAYFDLLTKTNSWDV